MLESPKSDIQATSNEPQTIDKHIESSSSVNQGKIFCLINVLTFIANFDKILSLSNDQELKWEKMTSNSLLTIHRVRVSTC